MRPVSAFDVLEPRMLLTISTGSAEQESNNTSATANPLQFNGQTSTYVVGQLDAGDRDWYSFTAPGGSKVWATIDTGGATFGASTNSELFLVTTDGATLIESDDNDGTGNGGDNSVETGNASVIAGRTLSVAGTYFLRVEERLNDQTLKPYTLFVSVTSGTTPETEPNNSAAVAQDIGTGSTLVYTGNVAPAADADFYKVTATAGNILHVVANGDPDRDNTGVNLVVTMIAPDTTTVLLTADSSATGSLADPTAEGFDFRITTSGSYFVRVTAAAGTGNYELMVDQGPFAAFTPETEPNNTSPEANSINTSQGGVQVQVGALALGDRDFYSINAPAASKLWAYVDAGGARNIGAEQDSTLTVFATDGTTPLEANDDGAINNGGDSLVAPEIGRAPMIAGRTLTAAGTYALRVEDFGNNNIIDPYRLYTAISTSSSAVSEPDGTVAIAHATPAGVGPSVFTSTFSAAADQDFYSVQVQAGDTLFVSYDGDPQRVNAGPDAAVGLFAPDGTTLLVTSGGLHNNYSGIAAGNLRTQGFAFRIVAAGTYFVRAQGLAAGDYEMMVGINRSATSPSTPTTARVYNLINTDFNVHFYTSNKGERDALKALINTVPTPHNPWQDAETTFTSFALYQTSTGEANMAYVQRLYNSQTSEHYYTLSIPEATALSITTREEPPGSGIFVPGWVWENQSQGTTSTPTNAFQGFMYQPKNPLDESTNNPIGPAGTQPVFRLYQIVANTQAQTGDHTLTNDPVLYTDLRSRSGWTEHSMVGFAPQIASLATSGIAATPVSASNVVTAEGQGSLGLVVNDEDGDSRTVAGNLQFSLAIAADVRNTATGGDSNDDCDGDLQAGLSAQGSASGSAEDGDDAADLFWASAGAELSAGVEIW